MAKTIELLDVAEVSRLKRGRLAFGIHDAVHHTGKIRRELPFVVENYGTVLRSIHRLNYVHGLAEANKLDAYVIYDGQHALGMATAQNHGPNGINLPDSAGKKGREVSYWHRDVEDSQAAIDLGSTVLHQLVEKVSSTNHVLWMVTLAKDPIKSAVNAANGFVQQGLPRPYDIDDGVREPRQLWVASSSSNLG